MRNTAAVEAEFRFEIVGAPREWGSVTPLRLTVAPQQEGTARLSFHPPRSSRATPGPNGFQVRVIPTAGEESAAIVIDGVIDVATFSDMAASLSPAHVTHRRARHHLTVENRGNEPTGATIEASSARGGLIVRATPGRVELAPGATADVEVTARTWRPHCGRPAGPRPSGPWSARTGEERPMPAPTSPSRPACRCARPAAGIAASPSWRR